MKKILLGILFFTYTSSAYADHLGPIYIGKERSEFVTFCTTQESAEQLAKHEETSIKNKESLEKYIEDLRSQPFLASCRAEKITYTPQEIGYEWTGQKIYPDRTIELSVFHIVKSDAHGNTIYVMTPDPIGTSE